MSVAGGVRGLSVRSVDVSPALRTGLPCNGVAAMRRRTILIAEPQQRNCNLARVAKVNVLLCPHCQAGRLHVVQVLMGQARSACHAQIPAGIGQRWAIICSNGVWVYKAFPLRQYHGPAWSRGSVQQGSSAAGGVLDFYT